MLNVLGPAALAMLLFAWPAAAFADDVPEEIEPGKVFSIHADPDGGDYEEYLYSGLAKANVVRLTLSVTKQEATEKWVPSVRFIFDESKAAVDDSKMENPIMQVAGEGAMELSLGFISSRNGVRTSHTYKRKLALNQKVNLEISWATAGRLVVTVDGQERSQITVPRKINFLSIDLSSGTFDVEDMIFHK
jgi:hypothetical protein